MHRPGLSIDEDVLCVLRHQGIELALPALCIVVAKANSASFIATSFNIFRAFQCVEDSWNSFGINEFTSTNSARLQKGKRAHIGKGILHHMGGVSSYLDFKGPGTVVHTLWSHIDCKGSTCNLDFAK